MSYAGEIDKVGFVGPNLCHFEASHKYPAYPARFKGRIYARMPHAWSILFSTFMAFSKKFEDRVIKAWSGNYLLLLEPDLLSASIFS